MHISFEDITLWLFIALLAGISLGRPLASLLCRSIL